MIAGLLAVFFWLGCKSRFQTSKNEPWLPPDRVWKWSLDLQCWPKIWFRIWKLWCLLLAVAMLKASLDPPFLHLSPFLHSFSPSFTIPSEFSPIFPHPPFVHGVPHFHAFSCRFSWFFPTFHQKSSRLTSLFSTRGEVLRSSIAGRCAKSWAWPRGAAGCWTQGCCSCPSPGRSRRPVGCWAVLSSAERWRVVLTLTLFELENRHFSWK